MSTTTSSPASIPPNEAQERPLSEPQRIIDTFIAPGKTFADIRRNASWWVPWVLLAIVSYALIFTVDRKIGFERVTENQIKMNPKAQDRLEQLRQQNPEAYQRQMALSTSITRGFSYCFPLISLLVSAIIALVLMATFNFGAGTEIGFKHALATVFYGSLPGLIRGLVATVTVFAGADPEGFNFRNPVGTNPAYYMSIADTPRWLYSLCSWIDVFTIWIFVLMGLGFAIVGGIKKSTGIGIMFAWYAILVLGNIAFVALTS